MTRFVALGGAVVSGEIPGQRIPASQRMRETNHDHSGHRHLAVGLRGPRRHGHRFGHRRRAGRRPASTRRIHRSALADVLAAEAQPELVVVGIGPGPFTGLRVGIAAGIAVGQARGIPVKGCCPRPRSPRSSTECSPDPSGPVLIASDARRKEVYFSVYDSADASLSAGPFVAKPLEVASVLAANGCRFDPFGTEQAGNEAAFFVSSTAATALIGEKLGRGFPPLPRHPRTIQV